MDGESQGVFWRRDRQHNPTRKTKMNEHKTVRMTTATRILSLCFLFVAHGVGAELE
jgi:hypothetical protein